MLVTESTEKKELLLSVLVVVEKREKEKEWRKA